MSAILCDEGIVADPDLENNMAKINYWSETHSENETNQWMQKWVDKPNKYTKTQKINVILTAYICSNNNTSGGNFRSYLFPISDVSNAKGVYLFVIKTPTHMLNVKVKMIYI